MPAFMCPSNDGCAKALILIAPILQKERFEASVFIRTFNIVLRFRLLCASIVMQLFTLVR
jgi:hypothetical protein